MEATAQRLDRRLDNVELKAQENREEVLKLTYELRHLIERIEKLEATGDDKVATDKMVVRNPKEFLKGLLFAISSILTGLSLVLNILHGKG